jgi:hypothetical protein
VVVGWKVEMGLYGGVRVRCGCSSAEDLLRMPFLLCYQKPKLCNCFYVHHALGWQFVSIHAPMIMILLV